MAAKYPPAIRAHVVEARRAGARVKDLSDTLGVSPALVSYWARTDGVPAETRPAPEMVRTCSVCEHPKRKAIDVALITSTVADLHPRFPDLAVGPLDRHRRLHLGLAHLGQYAAHRSCGVCDHPSRDSIDAALASNESRIRLEEATGIRRAVLRHHQQRHLGNVERDMTQAVAAIARLRALRKVVVDV